MVDRAEFIAGDDNDPAMQSRNQVQDGKAFCDGDQQPAGSFDKQNVATARDSMDVVHQAGYSQWALVFPGSDEWSDRLRKVSGVDLIDGQFVLLKRAQQCDILA